MLSESIAASGCGGTVWFSGSSSVLGEVFIVALLVRDCVPLLVDSWVCCW